MCWLNLNLIQKQLSFWELFIATKSFILPDNDRQVVEEPEVGRSEHVEVAGRLAARITRWQCYARGLFWKKSFTSF